MGCSSSLGQKPMETSYGQFREHRFTVHGRVAALFMVVLIAVPGLNARGDGPSPDWNPLATQQYLDARAGWWLDWPASARGQGTSCVSCHTAVPYSLARPVLAKLPGGSPAP